MYEIQFVRFRYRWVNGHTIGHRACKLFWEMDRPDSCGYTTHNIEET